MAAEQEVARMTASECRTLVELLAWREAWRATARFVPEAYLQREFGVNADRISAAYCEYDANVDRIIASCCTLSCASGSGDPHEDFRECSDESALADWGEVGDPPVMPARW